MKIAIVGLGLIGGSLLKAISKKTKYQCYGYNRTQTVLKQAQPYLHGHLQQENIKEMDIIFVCLTPCVAMDWIIDNQNNFKKGCIVADICGIKEYLVQNMEEVLQPKGVHFIGCHPMAGKEVGGFINSDENLFSGASYIITPTNETNKEAMQVIEELALEIGFGKVAKASPSEHDKIIAYTSQLAHIVSNAYVKSPSLQKLDGFTAGSFQDLTRVARLDSKMWTELFLLNKDNLLFEIDTIINSLKEYQTVIKDLDKEKLQILLEQGNQLKIDSTSK